MECPLGPGSRVAPRSLQTADLVAVVFLAVYGFFQLGYADVTIYSIDQILAFDVASDLVSGKAFPRASPLFSGAYSMPPGFYYILALPLLISHTKEAVFFFFGAFFLLSAVFAWVQIRRSFGPIPAMLYAAISSPFFVSLYTHTGWNASLTISFSNALLGCFLAATQGRKRYWAGHGVQVQ